MNKTINLSKLKDDVQAIKSEYDNINPAHYKTEAGIESIDVIEAFKLNFKLGNAVKYILRCGKKPGQPSGQDIKKAIWYLERELKTINKS
jgi:hypothetical protein